MDDSTSQELNDQVAALESVRDSLADIELRLTRLLDARRRPGEPVTVFVRVTLAAAEQAKLEAYCKNAGLWFPEMRMHVSCFEQGLANLLYRTLKG